MNCSETVFHFVSCYIWNVVFQLGIQQLKNHYWIPLAEQAVKVIYKLSEHPDKICGNLLKQLAQQVINMQSDETQASKDGK